VSSELTSDPVRATISPAVAVVAAATGMGGHMNAGLRRAALASATGLAAAILTACSGGSPAAQHSSTKAPSPTAATSTPTPTPTPPSAAVAPLTGLPGLTRRPIIVVKIENSTVARPQSGLQAADIVVEELVEGGITRFAVFFQSADPGTVGPVRSVRNVDAQIAGPTHGILAFSGGAGPAIAAVSRTDLQLKQEGDPSGAWSRSSKASAPHNLFLKLAPLWARAGSAQPQAYLPITPASTTTPVAGTPAKSAQLAFSNSELPSWAYDAASRRWLRSETGGKPAKAASGDRLVADNVLILRVRIGDAGYKDPIGNPVPETIFSGTGTAVLLTGGRQLAGRWSKGAASAPLQLTGPGGAPLTLPPGRTWIELVPVSGSVSIH
jgi:hypothetical protein